MRFCIQVVKEAAVDIEGVRKSSIGPGMRVLCGIGKEDDEAVADKMIAKLLKMRIFSDSNGKTNLSISDIDGEILLVSQFTLYANTQKGNRPSYIEAMGGDKAISLYESFNEKLRKYVHVETGIFGSDMCVNITNDGPVTILLERG